MENRRAHYKLILTNFAAAIFNVAAQGIIYVLLIDPLGPWQTLFVIILPAVIALVTAIGMVNRRPRGITPAMLWSQVGLQLTIWLMLGLYTLLNLPLLVMWFGFILTLAYAILAWLIMIQSWIYSWNHKMS